MTLFPYQVHRDCAVMAFMLIKFSTSVYKVAFYGLRFIMIFINKGGSLPVEILDFFVAFHSIQKCCCFIRVGILLPWLI